MKLLPLPFLRKMARGNGVTNLNSLRIYFRKMKLSNQTSVRKQSNGDVYARRLRFH